MNKFHRVNTEVHRLKAGDLSVETDLAHQMFLTFGISPNIADSLGYTARIVAADTAYRKGESKPISVGTEVVAINHLEDALGAPAWAHTDLQQIQRLRMHLLVLYPHLMGSELPPDTHGHHTLLSSTMSPLEAAWIGATMIYQKIYNPDFQYSAAKRGARGVQYRMAFIRKHHQRTSQMLKLISGAQGNSSLEDHLSAVNYFFDDLGIPPSNNANTASNGLSSQGVQK